VCLDYFQFFPVLNSAAIYSVLLPPHEGERISLVSFLEEEFLGQGVNASLISLQIENCCKTLL
jgi:hypothetical protein